MSTTTMSLLDRFDAAARLVRATVEQVDSWEAARARIQELVGSRPAMTDDWPELAGLGLTRADDVWGAEYGVSVALGGAAATGTVALASGPGRDRSTGVTPLHHVVCVRASQIVEGYGDLVGLVTSARPMPTALRLTTGPSRSGDIELKTIYGMHGPRTLTLLVVTSA